MLGLAVEAVEVAGEPVPVVAPEPAGVVLARAAVRVRVEGCHVRPRLLRVEVDPVAHREHRR